MNDKYKNAMSKINASEELKNIIALKMKEAQKMHTSKEEKRFKIKEWLIKIAAVAGIVTCGGIAYAGIKGKTIGTIRFSENYEIYEEEIENKYLEKDGNIVKLKSYVCDDGFLVLKFNITLSDKETEELTYLAFNDEIITDDGYEHTHLSGANYNLIIDGENYWLRGKTDHETNEINEKEYEFYQLYFLTDYILAGKEKFTITLNNVILSLEGDRKLISMDGGFEIEISKEKALKNTTKFEGNSETITYKKLSKTIDSVSITPLQNIVKISNVLDITDRKSSSEDWIGTEIYKVYDQKGNEISEFDTIPYSALQYSDGTIEEIGIELIYDEAYRKDFNEKGCAAVKELATEYIAIEQSKDITELNIEVLRTDGFFNGDYEEVRKIGAYHIDLKSGIVTAQSTDEIILTHKIDVSEIEEFTIEIPDDFKGKYTITKYSDINNELMGNHTEYRLEFENEEGYKGYIIFYLVKDDIRQEAIDILYNDGFSIIDKNERYTLVLGIWVSDDYYNEIKGIIDSVKLK